MKVLLDCTTIVSWAGNPTGIQRVILEILNELEVNDTSIIPVSMLDISYARTYLGDEVLRIDPGDIILSFGSNWDFPEHHALLMKVHYNGCKIITLIYDLIPVVLPHSFGPGFPAIYEQWLRETISISAMLLVISDSTRRDLIKYARNQRVPLPPTVSVRLGDNIPDTKSEMPSSFREICPADFLLSVGTQEFRKNHVTLLNAYRYLIREENLLPPHLVLVGRQGWLDQNLEHQVKNDLDLEGRILLLHSMSDQGLAWLYQNCLFTLYPSIYEGWGLPVAESLCYGKPCISSCTSSLSEIAPGLVDLLPPLDVIAWATAIKRYSLDRAELAASASRIQDRYTPSKWSKTAGQLGDLASYLRGDLT